MVKTLILEEREVGLYVRLLCFHILLSSLGLCSLSSYARCPTFRLLAFSKLIQPLLSYQGSCCVSILSLRYCLSLLLRGF